MSLGMFELICNCILLVLLHQSVGLHPESIVRLTKHIDRQHFIVQRQANVCWMLWYCFQFQIISIYKEHRRNQCIGVELNTDYRCCSGGCQSSTLASSWLLTLHHRQRVKLLPSGKACFFSRSSLQNLKTRCVQCHDVGCILLGVFYRLFE